MPSSSHPHQFIVCFIEESQVNLAICEVTDSGPTIISVAKPKEWQDELGLSDAIEVALEELSGHATGVGDVLFGLPEEWVNGADVKDERKEILKKLSQKLSWKPLGFVVSLEAVSRYLSHKKGVVSALFFDITPSQFRLAVFDHGNVAKQEIIGRSDDFVADIKEGLARLDLQVTPTIFYFFSSLLTTQQMESIKQTFLAHDWLKDKIFPQFPSIEFFSLNQVLESVCIMGGGEALKTSIQSDTPSLSATKESHKQPDDFGFTAVSADQNQPMGESFGVPITPQAMQKASTMRRDDSDLAIAFDDEEEEDEEIDLPKPKKRWSFPFFGKKHKDPKIQTVQPEKPKKRSFKLIPYGLGILIIVFLICAGSAYAYMLNTFGAVVEVLLQTKPITTKLQITLDPDIDETDPVGAVLKASVKTKSVTDSQETSTTGSKIIGENAKGKITIFNKTENEKTFSKGTEVVTGGKKFLLDEEIQVASATAKETSDSKTLEFGKVEVAVTASEIGAEANIEKEQDFTIANFSSDTYSGKNSEAFAGGSSREIQAVSKDDYQRVLSSLKKDLIESAQQKLEEEKEEGEYIILTDRATISDQEYSAEVGDETNSLRLTATVEAEAYSYFSSDLKPIAQQYLISEVPDGGVLLEDSLGILSKESDSASKSGQLALDAELSADYAPPTHSDEWLEAIKGSSIADATRILEGKEEIATASFSFTPSWSKILFGRLPNDLKRIQLNKKIE